MKRFKDSHGRQIRLTSERREHIVKSRVAPDAELFYRYYEETPVTDKHLCVIIKTAKDPFIITAFYTDTVKGGEVLWKRK